MTANSEHREVATQPMAAHPVSQPRIEFSAALLAGGSSTRMGRDKASLPIEGEPLWRRQIRLLESLSPRELFISGAPRPEWSSYEVIADHYANSGPLGGIVACLRRCTSARLLVLAVDLPAMTAAFLTSLLNSAPAAVRRNGEWFEPLVAVYPSAIRGLAEERLARGEYSLQRCLAEAVEAGLMSVIPIEPNERALFRNLNTPADLQGE